MSLWINFKLRLVYFVLIYRLYIYGYVDTNLQGMFWIWPHPLVYASIIFIKKIEK